MSNIKINDLKPAEFQLSELSDLELDSIVGGRFNANIYDILGAIGGAFGGIIGGIFGGAVGSSAAGAVVGYGVGESLGRYAAEKIFGKQR